MADGHRKRPSKQKMRPSKAYHEVEQQEIEEAPEDYEEQYVSKKGPPRQMMQQKSNQRMPKLPPRLSPTELIPPSKGYKKASKSEYQEEQMEDMLLGLQEIQQLSSYQNKDLFHPSMMAQQQTNFTPYELLPPITSMEDITTIFQSKLQSSSIKEFQVR
jgi:hypothetical protein